MDASDAAEYVQDLAGEDANIIFGAMYDDSKSDEATIHSYRNRSSQCRWNTEQASVKTGT